MSVWNIGGAAVTRIDEGLGLSSVGPELFLDPFDADIFRSHMEWLAPIHYNAGANKLVSSIHSWLIRTPDLTILLDTCSGNHKDRPFNKRFHQLETPYLERLRDAGVEREEVDIVMCTHLHTDHCGWNTQLENGRWVPTFPNARYLFSKAESDRWDTRLGNTDSPMVFNDSVLPVIESNQAVLLTGAEEIGRDLLIEPSPGHTPGHMLLKIGAGDDRGVFCGDVLHHPIQIFEPSWNTKFCQDPEQALHTRLDLLHHCAETRALLFPTHFAPPHVAGVFERRGRFMPSFVPAAGLG